MNQKPKTLTLPRPPTAFHLKAQRRMPSRKPRSAAGFRRKSFCVSTFDRSTFFGNRHRKCLRTFIPSEGSRHSPNAVRRICPSWRIGYGTWNVPTTFVGVPPSGCTEDRLKPELQRCAPSFPPASPSHSTEVAHLMSNFDMLTHFAEFSAFNGFSNLLKLTFFLSKFD
jgi:hypothetical protein